MTFKTVFKVYLAPLAILLATFWICFLYQIASEVFMSDPLWIMKANPWVGAVSNIGILMWTATLAICFFTGTLLKQNKGDKERAGFLYAMGSITVLLMLDDLFMLHEIIYPAYLHMPQNLVFSLYALLILGCLIRFRGLIFKSKYSLLAASFVFIALSTAFDIWSDYQKMIPWHRFYEDGFKLLGIFSWAGYFIILCADYLSSRKPGKQTRI